MLILPTGCHCQSRPMQTYSHMDKLAMVFFAVVAMMVFWPIRFKDK
jgi:hypothetical protein